MLVGIARQGRSVGRFPSWIVRGERAYSWHSWLQRMRCHTPPRYSQDMPSDVYRTHDGPVTRAAGFAHKHGHKYYHSALGGIGHVDSYKL